MMYEHEMVSRGRTVINNIQEEGIAVKVLRKRQYPHTRYPTRDPFGIPKPHGKNHLA